VIDRLLRSRPLTLAVARVGALRWRHAPVALRQSQEHRRGSRGQCHPLPADLVELAGELHVSLRACRVRKPTDTGGVERGIRYLKTRFFPARVITSLEAGKAALWDFLQDVASKRQHPVHKQRTVADVLAEQKLRLLPLPPAPIPTELVTSVRADKTALVSFDTGTPAASTTSSPLRGPCGLAARSRLDANSRTAPRFAAARGCSASGWTRPCSLSQRLVATTRRATNASHSGAVKHDACQRGFSQECE